MARRIRPVVVVQVAAAMLCAAFAGVVVTVFVLDRQSDQRDLPERSLAEAPRDAVPTAEVVADESATAPIAQVDTATDAIGNSEPLLERADVAPTDAPADRSRQRMIAEVEKSVVSIRTTRQNGVAHGSGFLINDTGVIVTNYHVIEGAKSVSIQFAAGTKVEANGWLAISTGKDLALLQCALPELAPAPLTLATELPEKTAMVFAVGSPLGLTGTVSDGIVAAIRTGHLGTSDLDTDATWIQSTAAISPGSSGGPLLNGDGQVVGVIASSRVGGQSLNFAIAAKHVADLLKEAPGRTWTWYALPFPRREQDKVTGGGDSESAPKAAEALADAIREAQAKQNLSQAVLGELNRIVVRAGDITRSLSIIEVEGTVLTQRRGQVMATAAGVFSRGQAIESQLSRLRSDLQNYQANLALAIANGDPDRVAYRQQQVAQTERQMSLLNDELSALRAQMVALDREARDLGGQIEYKAAQRYQLEQELATLRQRYDELSRQ